MKGRGVISQPPNGIRSLISRIPEGCPLTGGEFALAQMLAQGYSYREIAELRDTSVSIVRSTLRGACAKLQVNCSSSLIRVIHSSGWLETRKIRAKRDDGPTPAQAMYLAALQRWFNEGSKNDERQEMDGMLRALCYESQVAPPQPTTKQTSQRAGRTGPPRMRNPRTGPTR